MNRIFRNLLYAIALTGALGVSAATPQTDFEPGYPRKGKGNFVSFKAPEKAQKLLQARKRGVAAPSVNFSVPAGSQRAARAASDPLLCAAIINSNSSSQAVGVYSFAPSDYGFETLKTHFSFNANAGAGYVGNNTFYSFNMEDWSDWGLGVFVECAPFSTKSWESLGTSVSGDESNISTAMAYDEKTDKTYGCFRDMSLTGYEFGILDPDNLDRSTISTISNPWMACAFDASGVLYAIDADGVLSKVSLSNGALTTIGNTGLSSENLTSGTIDTATGIFYVATSNSSGSALYKVNTTTAAATKLYDLANNEELVGMFVLEHGKNQSADAPMPPYDLSANFAKGNLQGTFSFTTPETYTNGTAITTAMTYKVTLDGTEIANGMVAPWDRVNVPVTVPAAGTYTLGVSVTHNGNTSEEATVEVTVTEGGGDATTSLPYFQDFDTADAMSDMTIIDGNNDEVKWMYWNHHAFYGFSPTNAANDYLVTPGIYLEPGKVYRMTLDIWQRDIQFAETFELLIGNAPTAEALTTSIYNATNLVDAKTKTPIADVIVDKAGTYYFAVHAISARNMYGIYIDDLHIRKGVALGAPSFPTVTVTPDDMGALKAEVKVTAPNTTADDTKLSYIDYIEVVRDGKAVHRFTGVVPGNTYTFTDTPDASGFHDYQIFAHNSEGDGRIAEARAYVGINYAGSPRNIEAYQTQNVGEITVTWDAPTTDVDGNPINPALISYMIGTKKPNQNLQVKGRGVKETSYTFRHVEADYEQEFLTYLVCSETDRGVNDWEPAIATATPVGKPYPVPYAETFGSEKNTYITTSSHTNSVWNVSEEIVDVDGDDKFLMFSCYRGHSGEIITGTVSLKDVKNPVFSFWYLCQEDGEDSFEVYVNDGTGFKKAGETYINVGIHRKWTKYSVRLDQYRGKNVFFKIVYKCTDYRPAIDNIEVQDINTTDLTLKSYEAPRMLRPGVAATFTANVYNNGANKPERFTVELIRDGKTVASANAEGVEFDQIKAVNLTDVVAADGRKSISYTINVVCNGDSNPDDNTSASFDVAVVNNSFPAPTQLEATENGSNVSLSWKAPATGNAFINVEESFEDYPLFSTGLSNSFVKEDYIGDWTTIDADGQFTSVLAMTPNAYLSYPNLGQPMAFMIFDAEKAGSIPSFMTYLEAHSGRQCMACVASMTESNDDWLISPRLSGRAQTISFYAKSAIVSYGRESIEVLYSTTEPTVDSFTLLDDGMQDPPALWNKYTYDLPEGTKYFAIRCVSQDKLLLLVDDVTFEAANMHADIKLTGYNAYRDGVALNEAALTSTNHSHGGHDGNQHTYHVTAVYENGESAPSESVTIGTTDIDDIIGDTDKLSAYGSHNLITVHNPAGETVSVYDTAGRLITTSSAYTITAEATAGIYIVKATDSVIKVIVK